MYIYLTRARVSVPSPLSFLHCGLSIAKMMIQAELGLRIPEEIDEELKDEELKDEELKVEKYNPEIDDSIIEEGCRIYDEHLRKSSGFDVPEVPGMGGVDGFFGMILPYDHTSERVILCARLAVDEYNRRYKDEKLQFVRVLKAMSQVIGVFRNFLTFEAVDMSGETKVFQSVVDDWKKIEIIGFRLKPPESDEGFEAPRPWLWRDDCCIV